MTYLIALIIAIALGAVIALLSFVNIGSGFGEQSAAAKAQQFAQAGSQLEVAMAAYRADNAGSAYTSGDTLTDLSTTLSSDGWLKEEPVKPTNTGTLSVQESNNSVFLTLDGVSTDICNEISNLGGQATVNPIDGVAPAIGDIDTLRLSCAENDTGTLAAFKVE